MASSRKARGAEAAADALIVETVERRLRRHVDDGAVVTVGLSGGVDSIVLLDVLRRAATTLRIDVEALHVNHGLSPNATRWERFCREHCRRRGIPIVAVRVVVAGDGGNVEAEARRVRYGAYLRHGAPVVALAHNRDDQAETALLRLLRGSGVRGIGGMPESRPIAREADRSGGPRAILVRPMLTIGRDAIESYARRRRLRWIEDESNTDRRFARNFLRHEVMPLLESRFPGCRQSIARSAAHFADAAALLLAVAEDDGAQVYDADGLDVTRLAALSPARAANVLRFFLEEKGEPPLSTEVTLETLKQMTQATVDAQPAIVLSQTVVRRFRGRIMIDSITKPGAGQGWACVAWNGGEVQQLPDGTTLTVRATIGRGVSRARLTEGPVSLRRRMGGERLRLSRRGSQRTLKNLLQEHAVPPWKRRAMPLLFCGEQLVWVPAVGVASEYCAGPDEPALEFSWSAP